MASFMRVAHRCVRLSRTCKRLAAAKFAEQSRNADAAGPPRRFLSSSLESQFPLERNQLAIWWLRPDTIPRSYVERYAHWLSGEELSHICAAGSTTEQHTRLCARVLMRSAIVTCLGRGIQLSDLKFSHREYGKPQLDCSTLPRRARALDFNITHTDGLVGIAVGVGMQVGIDCERIDRVVARPVERISSRVFSDAEHRQLLEHGQGEPRRLRFIKQWTLKEAMMKAIGHGMRIQSTRTHSVLSRGLAALTPSTPWLGIHVPGAVEQLDVQCAAAPGSWRSFAMMQCKPCEGHVGAVCVDRRPSAAPDAAQAPGSLGWSDMQLGMFIGLPGDPEHLQLADGHLLALSQ